MRYALGEVGFVMIGILIVLHVSCANNKSPDDKPVSEVIGDTVRNGSSWHDTTLQLKFTSPVRSIFEDSRGDFWFGSWGDGVCRFDGKEFTYFTVEDGLSHNQVRNIQEDQNGVVWFENGHGISSYDGNKITTHIDRVYDSRNEWKSEHSDIWFKGDETAGFNERERQFGTYRYDGEQFTFLEFPIPESRINANNINFAVTTTPVRGKGGKLWFGTYAAVVGYDGNSFSIIDRISIRLNEDHPHLGIRAVIEDSNGNLWFGDNGSGVYFYDGDTTINFTEKHGLTRRNTKGNSPALDRIFSIGEDRDGNIWFGTSYWGVWRYNPAAERRNEESLTNYMEKDGLTSKEIVAIYKDKRDDLWYGGESVFKFNGKSFDKIY